MEPRGNHREANEAQEAPNGGPKGGKKVTGGGHKGVPSGSNNAHKGTKGEQTGVRRRQKGSKGDPQSELDDSYTVSKGPEGGVKGQHLQKPTVFEHS